jgi:hypothetical protein
MSSIGPAGHSLYDFIQCLAKLNILTWDSKQKMLYSLYSSNKRAGFVLKYLGEE